MSLSDHIEDPAEEASEVALLRLRLSRRRRLSSRLSEVAVSSLESRVESDSRDIAEEEAPSYSSSLSPSLWASSGFEEAD